MTLDSILATVAPAAAKLGIKLAISLVLLLVSFRLITRITRRLERRLTGSKRPTDKTVTATALHALRIALKALVVLCLIGYLGIDISGITALIASLGVGIGLAINGALANLVGGAILLLTRPFRIDDFIEAQGCSGTVEDIRITMTRLRTPDNKVVYLPNGTLSAGAIINYSELPQRRVDLPLLIGRGDLSRAKAILMERAAAHPKVLPTPAPTVVVTEQGAQGVNVTLRVWVRSEDFFDVLYALTEDLRTALDAEGMPIPAPPLDVRITAEAEKHR